jgi:gliding motility-associated-like protein
MFGKRLYLFLTFLLFAQLAQAQLSNFTLTVAKTDETCTSNGTLSFSVSNTTAGATMLYSVFLLPDVTTPISIQSGTAISGLSAGTYRVLATQSLGSQNGTQQQDITIVYSIQPLTYQLSSGNETCGNDGTITVTVTTGTAIGYEIFAGPMTRPMQTSNVFTGLTAGVYQIKVFDICNQAIVRTFTLFSSDTTLNLTLASPAQSSCTTVNVGFNFQSLLPTPSGVIKYPLQVITTYHPPSGPAEIYSNTVASGFSFAQILQYYPGQTVNYSFAITDGCGTTYNLNGNIQLAPFGDTNYTVAPEDCVLQLIAFSSVTALNLISAPVGYTGTVPQNFTPSIVNFSVTVHNLIPGTYVFTSVDVCGNPATHTIVIQPNQSSNNPPNYLASNVNCTDATLLIFEISQLIMISAPPTFTTPLPHDYTNLINSANYAAFVHLPVGTYLFDVLDRCGNPIPLSVVIPPQAISPAATILEGCENNVSSVLIAGDLVTISLTAAPAAYTGSVPANLTANITPSPPRLAFDTLPPGTYVFQSTNSCNNSFTTTVTVAGYQESTDVVITPNCGSFNLNLNHTSNNNASARYWVQMFNPGTGNWEHPLTNVVYTDGTPPTATNSFEITNNTTMYNMAFSGHFRILKVFNGYVMGNFQPIHCYKSIYEFDFSDGPRIIDVFSISCGTTYEVVVNAVGNSALTYRIIAKNGQPFLVQNGSSSLFTGLQPAIYSFEVEDVCHNTVSSLFEVLNPNPMTITASAISCDGDSVSLTVPNFPFLAYQWWKDTNTATILSTTNAFNIPSFNSAADNGIYHVRITYAGNPNSCLNQILDSVIDVNTIVPHAGNDNTVSYCGRQGVIDMNTLLMGSFDSLGTWSEITSSGMLINNLWDTSNVAFTTFQFKYTVSGNCALEDEALINVTINDIPQIPTASADPIVCETQNLNLFATTIQNAIYNWVGPNGFTSNLQNPIINAVSSAQNGTYTVSSMQNSCQSGTSNVTVLVNPLPSFALNQDCVGKDYQVWFSSLNEASFDVANSTLSWTGPNNFTSNQDPITITGGELGIYHLTITNQYGCEMTNDIEVVRNLCFIPNVITPNDDQTNENLDLTGFEVSKLEIYNRWGRKVYEKSNYLDEWHGQNMNGGTLPDSTYYYVIKLSTSEIKTGWIFLSRG